MGIFDFKDKRIGDLFKTLFFALDGTQKCNDDPDSYVENWTNRAVDPAVAAELCAGCPFLEQCRDYAVAAKEKNGIWGGTTPQMRGVKPKKWRK